MIERADYREKIEKYVSGLSDVCREYFDLNGLNHEKSTWLEYAREINTFFDYLITYTPYFCDKSKDALTVEDLKHINSQEISRYLAFYANKGMSPNTLARKRAAISSYFTYYVNNRYLEYNPIDAAQSIKIPKKDIVYLTPEEQNTLLDDVESGNALSGKQIAHHKRYRDRDYALIFMLLDTGMRVSELHGIDIGDINFDNCSVLIRRKGNKEQTLYFSDDTRDLLLNYIEIRKDKGEDISRSTPLFVSLKCERLTVRSIENLVKKYAVSSIPGTGQKITPHKMRSSFAMTFFAAEKDLLALQKKLGHKHLNTVQRYAEASDEQDFDTRSAVSELRKQQKK